MNKPVSSGEILQRIISAEKNRQAYFDRLEKNEDLIRKRAWNFVRARKPPAAPSSPAGQKTSLEKAYYALFRPPFSRKSYLHPQGKMAGIALRAPEVVVKLSGVSRGFNGLACHASYIARNGKVELTDENGDRYFNMKIINDKIESWKEDQNMSYEDGKQREAFHIVLSMPPGTNREKFKEAAISFGRTAFTGHEYLMAEHRDEEHPHVHFLVKSVGREGKRMNPRKADLQSWRELFASELLHRKIVANATRRSERGIFKQSDKQAYLHLKKRRKNYRRRSWRKETLDSTVTTRIKTVDKLKILMAEMEKAGEKAMAHAVWDHLFELQTEKGQQKMLIDKARKERSKSPGMER